MTMEQRIATSTSDSQPLLKGRQPCQLHPTIPTCCRERQMSPRPMDPTEKLAPATCGTPLCARIAACATTVSSSIWPGISFPPAFRRFFQQRCAIPLLQLEHRSRPVQVERRSRLPLQPRKLYGTSPILTSADSI